MEIMLVDLNQVAKIAGETFNCIWSRIARQIFHYLHFVFPLSKMINYPTASL